MHSNSRMTMVVVALIVALSTMLASCGAPKTATPEAAAGPVVLGYEAALTGPAGAEGLSAAKAVQLAAKQRTQGCGICGGRAIEVTLNDNKADPKEAANLATLLCGDPKVLAAVSSLNSSCVLAGAPIYNECGLVQGDFYGVAPKISEAGPYTFRVIPIGDFEAVWEADWLVKDDGHKRIASWYENTDYGVALKDAFDARVKENGGEIVLDEAHLLDQVDFSASITKIKAADPDAIMMLASFQAAGYFIKQVRDMGIEIPVYAASGVFNPVFIELGGAAAEGVGSSTSYLLDSTDPIVAGFVSSYRDAYGEDPANAAGFSFDMANLLMDALDKSDCTRKGAMEWLTTNVNGIPGVTGKIYFDENGDRKFDPGLYVKTVVIDGKWTTME
mgnify:CR=1 FL=1